MLVSVQDPVSVTACRHNTLMHMKSTPLSIDFQCHLGSLLGNFTPSTVAERTAGPVSYLPATCRRFR